MNKIDKTEYGKGYREGIEGRSRDIKEAKKLQMERVIDKIDGFFDEKQKQIKNHVNQFGKPGNRDIDTREKSMLLTLPMGYRKKLKEIFAEEKKNDGDQE